MPRMQGKELRDVNGAGALLSYDLSEWITVFVVAGWEEVGAKVWSSQTCRRRTP